MFDLIDKILIFTLSVTTFFFSYWFTLKIRPDKKVSVLQISLLIYSAIVLTGTVAISCFRIPYEYNYGFYNRSDLIFNMWLMAYSGVVLMPIGGYLSYKIFHLNIASNTNPPVRSRIESRLILILVFIVLISCSLVATSMYLSALSEIPIFKIFSSDISKLSRLRSDAGSNFSGYMWTQILIFHLPLILLGVSFFYALEKRLVWTFLFLLTVAVTVFNALIETSKAPLIYIIFYLGLVHTYKYRRFNYKLITVGVGVAVFFMMLMYVVFMHHYDRTLSELLYFVFRRISISSVHPLFWYQKYVEEFGHYNGSAWPNPGNLFDFHPEPYTVNIANYVKPELQQKGLVGTMPTVFFGQVFVNWGYFSAAFSCFILGFVLQTYEFAIRHLFKNIEPVILVSLLSFLTFEASMLSIAQFSNLFYSVPMFLLVNAAVLFKILEHLMYKTE